MTKLPKLLVQTAAAAAVGLSGLTIGVGVASAQTWYSHTERRCTTDGDRCATFRCDWGGCRRITAWEYNNYSGYYYGDNDYGRRIERCYGDRCATYRCDSDGDNCVRVTGWRYRY